MKCDAAQREGARSEVVRVTAPAAGTIQLERFRPIVLELELRDGPNDLQIAEGAEVLDPASTTCGCDARASRT